MEAIKLAAPGEMDASQPHFQPASELSVKLLKDWAFALFENVQAFNTVFNPEPAIDLNDGFDFYDEVRRFEIQLIVYALYQTQGHQRHAARLLSMKTTTLNAKLKLYNISARNVFASIPHAPIDLASRVCACNSMTIECAEST